jgi:hypothetical protein
LLAVPATGKSSYGRWLEENHGFIHVDVENSQPEAKDELRSLVWADPNQLIQHLKTLRSNVILDQGFVPHPETIEHLKVLKEQGVDLWWFNADRVVARQAFAERNESLEPQNQISLEAFDRQMGLIETHWDSLDSLFQPNILETLRPDRSRLDHEIIYRAMFT